ncbi:hypothetical protein [Paludifilum halophilum]|uniref:Uncharacterized protein n=1 Tax=Paludifilum halophilum TaxID=1642702 RepID=A0A235B991_9BACL|nr:hypothetical protein [Paludifilum halophilum]OYD08559.1 hypothetical protein CHM34_06960 [Paludifilum halophilum]
MKYQLRIKIGEELEFDSGGYQPYEKAAFALYGQMDSALDENEEKFDRLPFPYLPLWLEVISEEGKREIFEVDEVHGVDELFIKTASALMNVPRILHRYWEPTSLS